MFNTANLLSKNGEQIEAF